MTSCSNTISINDCTLETCCRQQGYVHYAPNFAATVAYLVIFAIFLFAQVGLGLVYRTWGFIIGMSCGLICEVLGYAGRIQIRDNPFSLSIFLFYFLPLGLGPAFITASIYLTLARIVVVYGEHFSRLRPRTYTVFFVSCDIFSLVIQAVGGSLTSSATNDSARQRGVNILIAGLTLQAASLATFITLCAEYAYRVRKHSKAERNPDFDQLRAKRRFIYFEYAISIAALFIFVRCVYRRIELAQGFDGEIANAEVPFLILEGPMIMVAVLLMTIYHPGLVFRGGDWSRANWTFRKDRSNIDNKDVEGDMPAAVESRGPSEKMTET